MSFSPRVSILIPNFNNGRESSVGESIDLLETLLQSLFDTLRDDPTPVEIIIADDGSTDDSLATARRWAQRQWSQGRAQNPLCQREAYSEGPLPTGEGLGEGDCAAVDQGQRMSDARKPSPPAPLPKGEGSIESRLPEGEGRQPRPFCRVIELPHCGVLSVVANRLMGESRGEICCRLDGDVQILTPNWASGLSQAFHELPEEVGVIGPKQLTPDGFIHSAGDWILHPRGYHHHGQGLAPGLITEPIEVDHVMGCFYCMRRSVWSSVGRYDESILRGQTIDYGLRVRLAGWRCFSIPDIEFVHHHSARAKRPNHADSEQGLIDTLDRFHDKWGFDRIAPDLDAVASRYEGTPLLWNQTVWPPLDDANAANSSTDTSLDQSRWGRFSQSEDEQQRAATLVEIITRAVAHTGNESPARIVQLGCGEGLILHLLAQQGIDVVGVDARAPLIRIGQLVIERARYPGERPRLLHQSDRRVLPAGIGTCDLVLMSEVIESHPNPVGLLQLAHDSLGADGHLLVITPRRPNVLDQSGELRHFYRRHELLQQIEHSRLFGIDHTFHAEGSGHWIVALCRAKPVTNRDVRAMEGRLPRDHQVQTHAAAR